MAVLGSILVDKEMMAEVGQIVRPNDFYAHVHETIFSVLYASSSTTNRSTRSPSAKNCASATRSTGSAASPYLGA